MHPLRKLARALGRALRSSERRNKTTSLAVNLLEDRAVPAASVVRLIDGSGNNLAHPTWGETGTDFLRVAPAAYADGISTPAGTNRPSARVVSNTIDDQQGQDIPSSRDLSAMVYAWGQFVDHDLDLTEAGTTEEFDIAVPKGDQYFDPTSTGTQVIPLTRTAGDPATGTSKSNPRQQVNTITTWLDGSMIYGSDAATAASLRTFSGGQLKTSAGNLLPTDSSGNFLAGDTRVDENSDLTSLQTLFVREHNRVAAQYAKANPKWTDEQVFQAARAWVIAEVQSITYNEWLPSLLGTGAMPAYRGYNANVNPGITNEFATAGFRFGHSIVGDDVEFLDNNGNQIADSVPLSDAFFNPSVVQTNGIDPILKYLSSDPSQEVDTKVVDDLRNFLFGQPGEGGLDLASLNIQRGRDQGLSDYNTTRAAYGLPKVTSFAQITSDTTVQAELKSLYGNVNNIDLWVGVLAENHLPGSSVGPLLQAIIVDQFSRLRDGDRFWYQKTFTGADLQTLDHTTLADIIRRNTTDSNLQSNVFFFRADVSGTAFIDANKDGKLNPGERGAANQKVQLVDADTGELVATTTTDPMGRYHFGVADGLGTGVYQVQVIGTDGSAITTRNFAITRGDMNATTDLPLPPPKTSTPTPLPAPRPIAPPHAPAFAAPDGDLFGINLNAPKR